MYIDTHAHLNGKFFENNIEESLKLAKEHKINFIVLVSTNKDDSFESIKMTKNNSIYLSTAGVHPCNAFSEDDFSFLNDVDPNQISAYGETGLDLHHSQTNPSIKNQINSFKAHINLAIKYNKPLIVHSRNAEEETYEILKNYPGLKFVMHSYTGSLELAKKIVDIGGYISFSGIVTFKNAKDVQMCAKSLPLENIIVETDSPFLTPHPHRGKVNEPAYVSYVAEYIASIRDEDHEQVIKQIYNNSCKLFNII